MRYLVTGGAGFIGSHLVKALLRETKDDILVIDNLESGSRKNLPLDVFLPPQLALVDMDFADKSTISDIVRWSTGVHSEPIECIFHLASIPNLKRSLEKPTEGLRANVETTVNALHLARLLNVPRFVFASSWTVYGRQSESPLVECMWPRPLSPYALSKWMGEEWCRLFARLYPDLSTLCLRLFNVYGPGSKNDVVTAFVKRARTGQHLQVQGDGSAVRDFVHVSDVVGAFLKADEFLMDRPGYWGVVNVGSGKGTSILELARMVQFDPAMISMVELPQQGPVLCMDGVANTQKVKALLGWQAEVPLEQGIQETLR